MVITSAAVTARSEPNTLNWARSAQGWPRVNILSRSTGGRLAKPFPHIGEWRRANPTPVGRSVGAWPTSARTVLDLVRARNAWNTAPNRVAPRNENRDGLTVSDLVAIAGLFLTTAFFYPAMAWLLLLS